jgi:plasmid maintenance system killer protein
VAGANARVHYQERVLKQVGKAPDDVEDGFFDMIEKVQGMTLDQIMADKGLNFEKDLSRKKEKIWTLRINKNWRAICLLHTGPVIEILAVLDHTKTDRLR